jgi:hypothetical protein
VKASGGRAAGFFEHEIDRYMLAVAAGYKNDSLKKVVAQMMSDRAEAYAAMGLDDLEC